MTGARLVARTVRGIESILADEIQASGLGTVEHEGHREVWFQHLGPGPRVLDLRCADDVFVFGAVVHGVDRTKASLRVLAAAAEAVPVRDLQALRETLGGPRQPMSLDVSASFLGRRNFNRYDVEDAVGAPLAARADVPYHSRRAGVAPPHEGMSWRVTVDGDRALLGLRIGPGPLHRRSYRRITRAGSVHPPLAAALVRLAEPFTGARVLDPCCGVGTIPIEAAAAGGAMSIIGSDHDRVAIRAAKANGEGTSISWVTADAGSLPLAHRSVDLVVTNPPWNRQVPPAGLLADHPTRFWRELRRVLQPQGRAAVLLPDADDHLVDATKAGLTTHDRRLVSVFGAHPEIVVLQPS
ncbi:methyltransferase domain-containing protein [Isoptericola croceus]|uniref:methyltransferase domain-containing protein n=1 Tax=Isoptericola croceus TaxID=3031406 RepID=UPI0023F74F35|nr:methyltransferase domain-containing protein [Isoptericola croceus]